MNNNYGMRAILLAAVCAAAGAGCANDAPATQVLTGKLSTTSGAVAVRAVADGAVVSAAQVRSDGSWTLSLPAGKTYRLEVLTAGGVRHVLSKSGSAYADLAFKVCAPQEPFDCGGVGDPTGTGPKPGDPGNPDDPTPCADPTGANCEPPKPCPPGDPTCAGGGTPGCDPATGNCDPTPCTDPTGANCEPPKPCPPDDPNCAGGPTDPPPPCDPATGCDPTQPPKPGCDAAGNCGPTDPPSPCDPTTGANCDPGGPPVCDDPQPTSDGSCKPPSPCGPDGACPPSPCTDPNDPTCPPPPPPCADPSDPNTCKDPCVNDPASCGCAADDPSCWPEPGPICDAAGTCDPNGSMTPDHPPGDFGCDDGDVPVPGDPTPPAGDPTAPNAPTPDGK